jgi:hypothetical protein
MTTKVRALSVVSCALVLCGVAAARPARFRAVSYDLARQTVRHQLVKSLLLYEHADLLGLSNLREWAGPQSEEPPLAALAASLNMYYAYRSAFPGANYGSALLSRYPIRRTGAFSGAKGKRLLGMTAEVDAGGERLRVVLVRPDSPAAGRTASDSVPRIVKAHPDQRLLVMASFDPGAAMGAVKAWGRAGLQDAAVALRREEPTFPAARPVERLDFILISGNLRPGLQESRVIREPKLRGAGDHLPLEVTFAF